MLTMEEIARAANTVAREFPIEKIELFGSYANGTSTSKSDVDLLVEFKKDAIVTLLTICGIKERMEELLNIPVDIIHAPIPKDSILEIEKVVSLYAA